MKIYNKNTYSATRFNHTDQFTFLLGKLFQQQIVALLQRKLTQHSSLEKSAEPLVSSLKPLGGTCCFAKETIHLHQATNKKLHVVSPSL